MGWNLHDPPASGERIVTYVLDGTGRIAVAQAGEVDWRAPGTREVLERLLAQGDLSPAL
jgi:hypothetical protein